MYAKKLSMKKITYKKLNGIVYTPKWIVNLILDNLNYKDNIETKKIIDPSCGEGAFLEIAVDRFIKSALNNKLAIKEIKKLLEQNIYGWDIDKRALDVCKITLDKIANKYNINNVNWNLINIDSLDKDSIKDYLGLYDFVVGNPPYIRIQNLEKEKRVYIQKNWELCKKGSTDIFIAFFELGFHLLNGNGLLGYITPNTYLKTSTGKSLRLFLKNKLRLLINFNHYQIFENATTYSLITILSKKNKKGKFSLYEGNDKKEVEFIDNIDTRSLNNDNWILTSSPILKRIKEIETRGIPLGKIARIHVGIATLADNYYIFENPILKEDCAVIRTIDGRSFEIEKEMLKPIVKVSVLKNSNEEQNRYIIFPYKKVNEKHSIIPEEELRGKYPLAYRYFTEIKDILLSRDKGKLNSVTWYAFGRSQGLDTSFGKKILTSPMNLKPNFIVWEKEEYTFFSGYCIKYNGNLYELAKSLNSEDMKFYINHVSRNYQNNYKSYSKTFIQNFGINNLKIIEEYKKMERDLTLFNF